MSKDIKNATPSPETTVTTGMEAFMQIDRDDIVAVKISEIEEGCNASINKCRDDYKQILLKKQGLKEELNQKCVKMFEKVKDLDTARLIVELKKFFDKAEVRSANWKLVRKDGKNDGPVVMAVYNTVSYGFDHGNSGTVDLYKTFDLPAWYGENVTAEAAVDASLLACKELELAEIKKLGQLDQIERKIRAELAKSVLAQSANGKLLLKSMDSIKKIETIK